MMRLKQLTHSILLFSSLHLQAQSGSFGNVFVHAQGEMALFSALHHFNNSGAGVLQGIVGTERTGANRFVSFVGSATPTGASDATHIDGYVRKYGVGAFTFPTGDNGKLRTCAISSMSNATESTTAAYFQANPNTAITSNLGGGNYGALPTGAPFNTSSKAADVSNLSNLEYWDINGAASVRLTLSYDATSAIHTLTNNDLSKLTIAGWNGTQWVTIPSTVTGTLTAGTIQTDAALLPNTYNVYTFAAKTLLAGSAPGCVTAGLDFWLDPAKNVTQSGNTVTDWADADGSGNNPTLTQATVALKPEYAAGDVLSNFNPYINFAGSERLNQDVTGSNYSNNHTTFGVVNHYGTKGSYTHFIRFASATNSDGGTHSWGLGYPDIATGKVGLHYITAPFAGVAPGNVYNRVNGNKTILQNVPTLYSASLNATTGATAIGHNGNEVSATGITGLSFVPYNSLTVGGGTVFGMPDNKTQEIIHYSRELSVQERQRVQTYLAIKHGITLDNQDNSAAITEGDYLLGDGTTKAWNYTANATYHNNVFGIGREDCQGLNQKQSTSILQGFQPIIGLTQIDLTNAVNPSVLTDGAFMICGSDNGATSFGTPIAPAAGVNANNRFTRIWKVQETGTVGSVKVAIPNMGSGGTVYLVRSTDATFNASDEFIALSNLTVGSNNYLAGNIDFNNGDYFTIATYVTAPGCVTAGLDFWLDPARNVTKSGNIVTDWADADGSGNNPTLTQATVALKPEYAAGDVLSNFNPYINFAGSERLNQDVTGSNYSNNHTTFGVVNQYGTKGSYTHFIRFASAPNSDGGTHSWGLGYPDIATNKVGLHYITAPFAGVAPGNAYNRVNGNKTILQNVSTLYSASLNATTGATAVGHNGNEVSATGISGLSFVPYNSLTVGGGTVFGMPDNKTQEIIHYSRELSVQERQRVQTYLAIKHGITLDNQDNSAAITEGDYLLGDGTTKVWNYTANTTYHNNVFGIGREDCQGLNQKQSISVNANSILTIGIDTTIATSNASNAGSFDTNASFLMIGDNNVSGVITPAGSACSPPSSDKRVAKVWKVVETGSVEKVKIQADLAGMGFNANYPVYMLVADDANFVSNAAMVPMTGAGTVFSTNYDFNGTKYISFAGNTTPLANLCTGDKQLNWFGTGNWWHWGERSKTITKGDQTFTVTVADAGNNILYPSWYPVSYGNSVLIPRYDNDNTGKVTFKVTMSKPASSVSFPIYGVDWHWGIDKVTVLGKLSGGAVTPKLSKSKYSWVSLAGNEADGTNYLHGGYTFLSTAYANFDSPIDEFTIEYVKTTTYPTWKIYNYIGIGAIDVACAPLVPEVITPDNVYVFKQVTPDSAKAGEKFTFKYTIQNLNCDNKTISLSDILPASLTYVDSTLATSLPIGTVNNYGSGQNLSLSTINVPKGTSYIYVNATGSTAGTYNSQANFNVTGGGSYASDDPKQSGSNNPTRVVILASDPVPNLSIVKAVDKTTVQRDSIITYTYTITNNGAAAINTYLEDALYSAATFVSGSLANAPAGTQLGAYANTSTFLMRDLNLAAGATKIFSIKVNVGQMPVDSILKTIAKITPDYQSGYQQITTFSNAPQTQIVAAVEICNNGIDDDGDGLIDCADPDCGTMTLSSVANTNPTIASCPTLNNGTITVTATGTNLQYSKDNGTTWQVSNVFTGLVANSYTIKIRDSISNCSMNYASNPVILTAPSCGVRQINYTLRYNAALSRYELYAKPNWNSPNMSTDCHATIVVPASLPDSRLQNVIPGTDAGGAGASDVAYAPTEDPAHDFHYTTFIINSASYVAGQELFCMSFTLPVGSPAACMTGVRLYNNVSDPVNSPGGDINGGDFKNYYADVMSAADYYGSNYGVASDLTCPSTGLVVAPKAFLSGSYVSATGMMYDSLRVKSLIPIAQPYNTMGYAGTETVAPAVFATTGANAIVDWVLVQLRSDTSTVVAQQAALIQRDGDIVSTDGVSSLTFAGVAAGNYYVSVKHRNHLGVMTANALALTSTVTNIDFTIAATPNFQRGGNFGSIYAQRTFGTTRALWSGNMGGGNTVKANGAGSDAESVLFKILLDMGNTELLPTFIIYNGYFREDGNLDGKVIYQGASSETDALLFNILLHGGNGSVLANFVIYEQIP